MQAALALLRCLECGAPLDSAGTFGEWLRCSGCGREYPIVFGSPVMPPAGRDLQGLDAEAEVRRRTAESFAYEWQHFGGLRDEWERNFREYIRPHEPASLKDRLVLDVGAGSGGVATPAARL